jgi:Flp pilus assembly protein TadG
LAGLGGVFYGTADRTPDREGAMLSRRSAFRHRTGTASVEAGVTLSLIIVPLMIGIWEMGQVVHAQQVVSNAAREGARLGAQGLTIVNFGAANITTYAPTAPTPYGPNVNDTVYEAIVTGGLPGLQPSDVTMNLTFLNPDGTVNTAYTDPYQAPKLQRFRVSVSVPWSKVRWVNLGIVNPTTISYQVDWYMLVDDPFQVNTTIPSW